MDTDMENTIREVSQPGDALQSKEHVGHSIPVVFYKLGGTWDMVERNGRRVGTGNLDDDALKQLQTDAGLFQATTRDGRLQANKAIAKEVYQRFQATSPEPVNTGEHLSSWCHNKAGETFGDFADGSFNALFSGDSSHLKIPLIAPMIATLLDQAKKEPSKPLLGGQGTDTADIAALSIYDALVFDTQLPPLVLTGANTPHFDPNSDAPENFIDLAKVAHTDLASGAYWVFHGNLYKAADFVKIDPEETRRIETQSTFYSPHQNFQPVSALLEYGREANWQKNAAPSPEHVVNKVTAENIYDAFESIYVMDLGSQNAGWIDMERIFDPEIKAIIVAAHSLGNVDNETRMDLVRAAKMGKLVIDSSRTLIGTTNETYESSLLGANIDPQELGGSGHRIIAAHKLNKTMSRALLTRALLEGLDQTQTQTLFSNYARSRKMS